MLAFIWFLLTVYYLIKVIPYAKNTKKIHWTEFLIIPLLGPILLILNWRNLHNY